MENKNCCSGSNTNSKKTIKIKPITQKSGLSKNNNSQKTDNACCCTKMITLYDKSDEWIVGEITTSKGIVPQVSTKLLFKDILVTLKTRFGINRMNYKINPGLYAVGTPDNTSPVLVSCNYKLTFDALRKELTGLNLWILILDTKGINVWCAAGKGTFGTEELLNRLKVTSLKNIVSHNTLILPQLGAPGVSAHIIAKQSGFKVIYGPVRSEDIKEFISSSMKATQKMRQVKFTLFDRLVLTPIELVGTFKIALMIFGVFFLLNLFAVKPFGVIDFYLFSGSLITGCVLTPLLLPWIPGRAFAWKGWLLGLFWVICFAFLNGWSQIYTSISLIRIVGYLLVFPAVSAFCAMNFTGTSTYTSLSGVLKEMKIAVPIIAVSIGFGILLILLNTLFNL